MLDEDMQDDPAHLPMLAPLAPTPYSCAGAESHTGFRKNCNLVRAALPPSAKLARLQVGPPSGNRPVNLHQ